METTISILDDTLSKSIARDFQRYLGGIGPVTRFSIFSDYCLEDKHKPNKVASFTIIPSIVDLDLYGQRLNSIAPRDLKNTSSPNVDFLKQIASGHLFHISFVLGTLRGITHGPDNRPIVIATIDQTIKMVQGWSPTSPSQADYYRLIVDKLNGLRTEMLRRSANLHLFRNTLVVSLLAGYVAYMLTRYASATHVAWISDRDKIVNTWRSIAFELCHLNHHSLCSRHGIPGDTTTLHFLPRGDTEEGKFLDAFNRIPDHLAGALASWSIAQNTVHKQKHSSVLEQCFADNLFCSIFKLSRAADKPSSCSRIVVSRNPI